MFDLKRRVVDWRDQLQAQGGMTSDDLDELESHLIDEIGELTENGLSEEEAYIIGIRRLGKGHLLSKEFAKVNADKMWKNLLTDTLDAEEDRERFRNLAIVVILAALSGAIARAAVMLFGADPLTSAGFEYWKFAGMIVIPFVGVFLALRNGIKDSPMYVGVGALLVLLMTGILFPFEKMGNTELLFALHSPVVLWLLLMPLYRMSGEKRQNRMNFVRFTGEVCIYTALLYCGGMVLIVLTLLVFSSLGYALEDQIFRNVGIIGAFAAPVVAAYLVEEKKSVVENLAPILAKIFSPMFFALMTAFIVVAAVSGKSPFVNRQFLLGFEVLLVLVLAMVMYVISARTARDKPEFYDYLNVAVIAVAMIVDLIVLASVVYRTVEGGLTANRLMVIGLNVLFLVHFIMIGVAYLKYLSGGIQFDDIEYRLTDYLPAYLGWAAVVSILFPPLFQWV